MRRVALLLLFLVPIMVHTYPIGTPGIAWGETEKTKWRETREIQRCYETEVVSKILKLKDRFQVQEYGALSINPEKYKKYYVKTKNWSDDKPCVMITGGVHGYETSGVQGALQFLETRAEKYSEDFNIVVAPCLSPWGYETIQRWNCEAVDPNRSFNPDGKHVPGRSFNPEAATEESLAIISLLKKLQVKRWLLHLDLHETTDTDDTEFRPAKAARDGSEEPPNEDIPDGFYLVTEDLTGSTKDKAQQDAFCKAIIDSVRKVTHIAPTDADGKIIGEEVIQEGVIVIPASFKDLGLCAGVTDADFAALTEVYPDSPSATDEQCNDAQVACIEGALEFLKASNLR